MTNQEVIQRMCDSGVLPVFRTSDLNHLIPVTRAIYEAGIGCIEYTMTMPNALEMLKKGAAELPEKACLGAGTIVDGETVERAVQAGARFIASPGLSPEMIKACQRNRVVSVVGAMTPSEIMQALDLGADVIKVFCAASVGPVFFANMPGPFPDICMMAAGGMTLENLKDYIIAGARIVTYVPNLADPEAYAKGDLKTIACTAQKWLEAVKSARHSN